MAATSFTIRPSIMNEDGQQSRHQSIFISILNRMHPRSCLQGCGTSDKYPSSANSTDQCTDETAFLVNIIPNLLADINIAQDDDCDASTESKKVMKRTAALRKLYELTGSSFKENRMALLCTSKWDIITVLASCLDHNINHGSPIDNESTLDETRRIACLILNNLSIPFENKAVMVFGPGSLTLIQSLVKVIRLGLPETYLCCICLMNMSFLDDASTQILHYSPAELAFSSNNKVSADLPLRSSIEGDEARRRNRKVNKLRSMDSNEWKNFSRLSGSSFRRPSLLHSRSSSFSSLLNDPDSLLKALESMMQTYRPFLMSNVLSVEGEAVRWSVGLLRNLTKKEEHCVLISKTEIPSLIVSFISNTIHPLIKWTKDSLEEMSLTVLCNLARWEDSKSVLKKCEIVDAISPIAGKGGIHDFRAGMILASLSE